MTTFSLQLKQLRDKKWLSRAELAQRSSVCYRSIKYYEGGHRLPALHNFNKLLLGLRVSDEEALSLRAAYMETLQPGSSMQNVHFDLLGNAKSGCNS